MLFEVGFTSEAIAFQQALHVLTRMIGSRARKSHTKTLCHQIYEGLIDSGDIASTRSKTNLKEHNKNVQSFLKNFPISE
jgi:hypothetical protein